MSEKVKSLHKFLFPFRWRLNENSEYKKESLNKVVALLDKSFWKKFTYQPLIDNNYNTYNEASYFYEYVRDVLNLGSDQNMVNGYQFDYAGVNPNSKYIIHIKDDKPLTLSLTLDDIYLNLYENGVGILSFHLINEEIHDFNQILKVNEYGRRVYPQFLGSEFPFTDSTKFNFLAEKIVLENVAHSKGVNIEEDFSYYDILPNILDNLFVLPSHIQSILGEHFGTDTKNCNCAITPILDDRMFVLSFIIDSKKIRALGQFDEKNNEYVYTTSSEWYRYLFVDDSAPSCTSKTLLKQQLERHTNDRWIGSINKDIDEENDLHYTGQLFGLCRYSFVVLVGDGWYPRNIVSKHFSFMYFQIVQLCLLQRAYIIHFGGEVARISNQLTLNPDHTDKIKRQISRLYLNYIKFVNRIYFREVTPQEQGIELYNKMQSVMRIREDVDDLDKEIQELNTYVETYSQSRLSSVATWFLPVTLLAGIMGMNTIDKFAEAKERGFNLKNPDWEFTALIGFTIVIVIWTIVIFAKQFRIIQKLSRWNKK